MKYLLLISLLAAPAIADAQKNLAAISQQILHDGLALYQLEHASWVSTDLLLQSRLSSQQKLITGCFSYAHGDSVRTLFLNGSAAAPQVLAEYRYAQRAISPTAGRRYGRRPLLPLEKPLLAVRRQSLADLQHVAGVELSPKAVFNAVVLPKGDQTWVYILTSTNQPGVLLLGNDYLLRYNAAGKLLRSQKLHRGVIPLGAAPATVTQVRATLHSHQQADSRFITPTDICTLLLYRRQLAGRSHIVLGPKYVSIFSLDDARLLLLSRREFAKLQRP